MNPLWLKPTAEEDPAAGDSKKSPKGQREDRPAKPQQKPKSEVSQRPKPAAKPSRRRKKPAGGSRPKTAGLPRVALLCDPDSLTRGLSEAEAAALDLEPTIQRLTGKGRVVARRAYADWDGSPELRSRCRQDGFELIAGPESGAAPGAAGIQLAVDAMDLCHAKEPVDTFVLISGDGNLAPLVAKLKEAKRKVLGVGPEKTSSRALVDLCDEYLFCDKSEEDVPLAAEPPAPEPPAPEPDEPDKEEAMGLMVEAIETLVGEDAGVLWGSVIKQAIQRNLPSFTETDFGFSSFTELLEEAERRKLIKLKKDERSGTYMVTGFSPR